MSIYEREILLIGEDGVKTLAEKKVVIFGLGGVGSYVCEGLARAGIGHFVLVDSDTVALSNINRQLFALHSTLGRKKVDVAKKRILDINPDAEVDVYDVFYLPENAETIDFSDCDYIVDAIDTVSAKIEIAVRADEMGVPIISCMGTGNRLDPLKFEITDIYKTDTCHLARVLRRELRKRKVKGLKVLYSTAEAISVPKDSSKRKQTPGSISFVPSVAGLICAGEVVKDLLK